MGLAFDRKSDKTDLGQNSYTTHGSLAVSGTVLDGFILTGSYERHPILRNLAGLTLGYEGQIVQVSAGPFAGFVIESRNPYLVKPGVTAEVRAELWQFGFASLASDVTLDPVLDAKKTDFRQFHVNAQTGFYVPNIITSFEFDRATLFQSQRGREAKDRTTEYAIQTEIFQKNIPYRVLLRFAYRNQRKDYLNGSTHAVGAALFTPGVTILAGESFTFSTELENGIYVFGRKDLLGETVSNRYFFRASVSLTQSF
jgi:hypothetical protein